MRSFSDLDRSEVLALAITLGEEHARIYAEYAHGLFEVDPSTGQIFAGMAEEEHAHRAALIELYRITHGDHIPLIRPQDVRGFAHHDAIWTREHVAPQEIRDQAERIVREARQFYETALSRTTDAAARKLFGDLLAAEDRHLSIVRDMRQTSDRPQATSGDTAQRTFVLHYIQPGLNGLIDGSISTLAPIFAVAFATYDTWTTFLVGLAASIGSGISMGIAEAMSDDGLISGRGHPWKRGTVTGVMTAVGGLGHTLPYLISDFWTATAIAAIIVVIELWVIAWVRARYMETPFMRAALEVVAGGLIVFGVGIAIGSA
ncbi:MAG TPA: ferritin family protein [Hyphomicrobium sp.]|nr:ferritin family protein [Hyphomicrobium sp.]HRO49892.1 ferritin family protein [Hyphomicrobium sp.]